MNEIKAFNYIEKFCDKAKLAMRTKEPEDLTEDEKFAIAFVHGVPIADTGVNYEEPYKFELRTVPCSVTKINGEWRVFM